LFLFFKIIFNFKKNETDYLKKQKKMFFLMTMIIVFVFPKKKKENPNKQAFQVMFDQFRLKPRKRVSVSQPCLGLSDQNLQPNISLS